MLAVLRAPQIVLVVSIREIPNGAALNFDLSPASYTSRALHRAWITANLAYTIRLLVRTCVPLAAEFLIARRCRCPECRQLLVSPCLAHPMNTFS